MSTELLLAGALIPLAGDGPGDPVSARVYKHAALGDRAVIKLVADNLAAAEDLSLEFLGFEMREVRGPLARGRRQALGFPAWALINDPKNGAYALDVVKEMERVARVAKSKPGNAKDQYAAIATRLARSVPQFLPTFYEQAGRAFVESGNNTQAATMFSKARDAERVYNLSVDEQRRRDVYLEFALTAALSAGALEEYASELSRVHSAAEAYELFREVCIQRCRGGLPPWAAMAEQLRAMGAKAGLDRSTEDERVLIDLLEVPATAGAAFGFWKAYEKALVAMARKSPSIRGRLLNLHPWPPRDSGAFLDWWLKLLEQCGATEALVAAAGELPQEFAPTGGPAVWLSKVCAAHNKHDWGRGSVEGLLHLMPKMGARLKADGEPVDLYGRHPYSISLDLIDLALELGIPLAPPAALGYLQLERWLGGKRTRALKYLAADEIYGPRLMVAVDVFLRRNHADVLIETPGLSGVVARWLDACADRFENGGLLQFESQLDALEKFTSPRTFALNPAARDRIARASALGALMRTLRGGLLDEFGWPALEGARAKLVPKANQGIAMSESWPFLVVSDGAKAFVVARDRIVLEHDLRVTDLAWGLPSFVYAGGQLLVTWASRDGPKAYWSGRPAETFKPDHIVSAVAWRSPTLSFELADGGRTTGWRALHAGDTKVPDRAHVLTDGEAFWRVVGQPRTRLEQFDPATGRGTGADWPRFLSDYRADGVEVDLQRSWLAQFEVDGPLGRAGLGGMRARRRPGTRQLELESPDGRTFAGSFDWTLQNGASPMPSALVTFPADAAPRALAGSWQNITLFDSSGAVALFSSVVGASRPTLAPSTPTVPPAAFWQHFAARDPRGSAALRAISEATAKQLLDSAVRETAEGLPATGQLVKKVLPEITNPELLKGVMAAMALAAKVERGVRSLRAVRDPVPLSPPRTAQVIAVSDAKLAEALSGLLPSGGWYGGQQSASAFAQLRTVADYIGSAINDTAAGVVVGAMTGTSKGTPMPKTLPNTNVRWNFLAGRLGAVLYRAASPAMTEEQRETLLSFIETWADTVFARHPEWFRVCIAGQDGGDFTHGAWLSTREWRHYFYAYTSVDRANKRRLATVIEGSKTGFKPLNAHYLISERPMGGPWETRDALLAFVKAVRTRGPAPWRQLQVERFAAHTGVTTAEAALILAGFPNLGSHQHNFLDKAQREAIGLKSTEASAGRDALKSVNEEWRLYLLAAAMPPKTLDELWDPDYAVGDRLAGAWLTGFSKRAAIDDELMVAVDQQVKGRMTGAAALEMITRPAESRVLNTDGAWALKPGTWNYENQSGGVAFDGGTLLTMARLVPWLFLMLPVGDPARAQLPLIIELVRARLKNPRLILGGGVLAAEVQGRALKELVPSPGPFVLHDAYAGKFVSIHMRPAEVSGREDPRLVAMLGLLAPYSATNLFAGPAGEAFATRVRQTPVSAGSFEANPAKSVPDLVARVASSLAISAPAAALYLQVLTLAEPTVKNVVRWNAWTGKEYKEASEELVAKELVVSGKRPRAAREIFLPGAWEALKAPNLPIEAWKMPIYEGAPIDGRLLILRPVHELFAQAWARIESGDRPRFEEVASSRTR